MNLELISSENLSKELAYLFGVYLTDGSICHRSDQYAEYANFSLKAIDKDFVEFTLKCMKKFNPLCKANIYISEPKDRYWPDGRVSKCQKQYCIGVGFTKFKDFFENQTGKKHHIPLIIWNASLIIKKWFIAGAMDGDGWISKIKRKYYKEHWKGKYDGFQYRIGIGKAKYGWIHEFKTLLQKMGVKTSKTEIRMDKYRKIPMVRFHINIDSFVKNGLFFTIERKQNRVKLLRDVQRLDVAGPMGSR
jgi:hypothetical protein